MPFLFDLAVDYFSDNADIRQLFIPDLLVRVGIRFYVSGETSDSLYAIAPSTLLSKVRSACSIYLYKDYWLALP